jgi:hypothetical protein
MGSIRYYVMLFDDFSLSIVSKEHPLAFDPWF